RLSPDLIAEGFELNNDQDEADSDREA
ncbi:MAG: hypothetical protein RLZZ459_1169, partial [Cyanobacteriota bacterium]